MNVKDPLFADSDRFASVARETPPERLGVRTQATRDHRRSDDGPPNIRPSRRLEKRRSQGPRKLL